jgi:hypothetical protein
LSIVGLPVCAQPVTSEAAQISAPHHGVERIEVINGSPGFVIHAPQAHLAHGDACTCVVSWSGRIAVGAHGDPGPQKADGGVCVQIASVQGIVLAGGHPFAVMSM